MDKKHLGRPKGRTKKYNIHTAINADVGSRLREWLDANEFKPQLKQVLEAAITEFLDRRTHLVVSGSTTSSQRVE